MRALWLLCCLAACAAPARQQPACDGAFELANTSDREIEQLYAGGRRDLLEPGVMRVGERRRFQAEGPGNATLRIVFTDGTAAGIGQLDLCTLPVILVTRDGVQARPGVAR